MNRPRSVRLTRVPHRVGLRLSGALGALYFMTVLSAFLGVVLPNLISQEPKKTAETADPDRCFVRVGVAPTNLGLRLDPLKCRTNDKCFVAEEKYDDVWTYSLISNMYKMAVIDGDCFYMATVFRRNE